jgi:hypothetical protein
LHALVETKFSYSKGQNHMEQAASPTLSAGYYARATESSVHNEANSSGVSWAAVIGGGFVTAAISLILLSLGAGLGLSSVSVWSNAGATASTIGTAAILWLILMQIMSSSLGGYLAGRLRTKWTSIHSDEVYFRDTAHGFLTWAVALVVTAACLASAGASMMGVTAPSASDGAVQGVQADGRDTNGYFIDTLLRSENAGPDANGTSVRGEVGRIFASALKDGTVSADDQNYLDRLVMVRAGLNQPDADKRVSDVFARAKLAAEAVRKSTARVLLWTFVALLMGAFCASFAATIGGKQRDHVAVV